MSRRTVRRNQLGIGFLRMAILPPASLLGLLGCTDHNSIHPINSIVRAEGSWVIDPAQASRLGSLSPTRQHLEIRLTSKSWPGGSSFSEGVPYAAGTASWSGSACPVSLQIGSPQNHGAGFIWVAYEAQASEVAPKDGANPTGFNLEVMIAGPTNGVRGADPADDWLFVDFYDAPLAGGENWLDHTVRYVRAK